MELVIGPVVDLCILYIGSWLALLSDNNDDEKVCKIVVLFWTIWKARNELPILNTVFGLLIQDCKYLFPFLKTFEFIFIKQPAKSRKGTQWTGRQ